MKNYLFMATVMLLGSTASAQENSDGEIIMTKMVLPNGKELKYGKLDSLKNAWGGEDRVLFRRKENEKEIIYLVRKTDEEFKKEAEAIKALNAMVGNAAPQFEITDLNGKKWSLKDLRGKIVALNFWFTSCEPCIREIPELNQLVEKYKGKDIVFLALATDKAAKITTFLEKREFGYTIVHDSFKVSQDYNITSWPTSIVIDKKGIIRFVQVSGEDIQNKLKTAINKAG
ncbi:redoxin domain-containing protein [Flavobacterium sp. Sd200]|uniref:peroxiredoxin family protein n=1 Tax=Flavobacterium sp. Sd200 TaxID=2692211 RepID=UPI001369E286|nr:TlpA disulfide reductase family protein [Flavobacterium sp. Sd200]MXN89851.1 redoxin domain-containing protein [Flavobacterium sp. Sd200]